MKIASIYFFISKTVFFLVGCNGGGGSDSNANQSIINAPSALDIVGSEIAFNPIIKFTTSNECIYDNTIAQEQTFPKPESGAIQASYTVEKSLSSLLITISSTDLSFGEDLVLELSGWTDTNGDNLIDQFSILPTLGDDLPLNSMIGQFTENPPDVPNSNVDHSQLPEFLGGDSNTSPTLDQWQSYVVGNDMVFSFTDGNISYIKLISENTFSSYDSQGNLESGTYDYDKMDAATGRLSLYQEKSYQYGSSQTAGSSIISSTRTAIFTLNFFNTDSLSDATHGKVGGLGVHFIRDEDREVFSTGSTTEKSTAYGSLRIYQDASLLYN